jgi:hypothetical protein
LDDALKRLEQVSTRLGRASELMFFGGLEIEEIAIIELVSLRTTKHDRSLTRTWLHLEMARGK